jgi:hypothetical protein
MNWLRRLFGGADDPSDQAIHLYVRCGHCGAPLHVRAHRFNDLAIEYDDGEGVAGYRLRKEMMDGRCFRLMYADLAFDRNRHELSRTIEGGEFISADEYQRLAASAERP